MATSTSIRIDNEIVASAKHVGDQMCRSAAQQVTHWARIGREFESGASVSHRDVLLVLSGDKAYDDLGSKEQALVRTAWSEGIAKRTGKLNLAREFEERGESYSEFDTASGEVVVHTPDNP
jgi:ParD-like antitoxin of type II bacterial toxin-antitoxin system